MRNKIIVERSLFPWISLQISKNWQQGLGSEGGKSVLLTVSLGFSLNLSYVISHACEQKRHSQKRGRVSDGNHTGKKEKIIWGIKREDDCEGLVGFTKRVGALTLFAAILFLLICLHPSFSECISPNPRTSYKREFCIFLMSVGKKSPRGDFLMNTCWRHFMGSEKVLRRRCTRMIIWSGVLWGQVGCLSHI